MHTVKPLDADTLLQLAGKVKLVVTVEEHTLIGGFSGAVVELFADHEWSVPPPRLKRLGLPDRFLSDYGSQDFLLERCGLDPEAIAATVRKALPGRG
jgi:transketolase